MAFDHLSLPQRVKGGDYNSPYGKGKRSVVVPKGSQTIENENNRGQHGSRLSGIASRVTESWQRDTETRTIENLPELPTSKPLFFQVDPKKFSPETLASFGFEIISEELDGFLIGATADLNLSSLTEKIEKFIAEQGKYKNTAAQLWNIIDGKQWRIDHILTPRLLERWEDFSEDEVLTIDIAIACYVHVSDFPPHKENETEEAFNMRVEQWHAKKLAADIKRDEVAIQRQDELERFLEGYGGQVISEYVDSTDSFSCRVEVCGKGVRDLVLNYPYLFEVDEYDNLKQEIASESSGEDGSELELISPPSDSPIVCIVDSGIQEQHRLLRSTINPDESLSFVPDEYDTTSDQVSNGGHGTKVAGAVLYPREIPSSGTYELRSRIQNARVLNSDNSLDKRLFPAGLMKDLVGHFHLTYGTKLFNMSIASRVAHRVTHMSEWAESIDRQTFENDILFVLSSGNIRPSSVNPASPGLVEFIDNGIDYPDYLSDKRSGVANPSHSLFSLTVGSICHTEYEDEDIKSFGKEDYPSAFSRTGLGIWGSIKPEVVEYGGDFSRSKSGAPVAIYTKDDISVRLVQSTLNGGPAIGFDIGTSFSAPKVSSILSELQRLFPDESTLLYKALLVQSARWPIQLFNRRRPEVKLLQLYGYGIPNLERATTNNDWRVTLVNSGTIAPKQADVYEIRVPENLRRQGDQFEILVEVTLTFKAKPRRTRSGFGSYLSGWVDWHSSKLGESQTSFQDRLVVQMDEDDIDLDDAVDSQVEDTETIPWTLRREINAGITGARLNRSATQKDWVKLKSYQLTESFCIGVVGHKGWEKDIREAIPYSIAVSFESINKDLEVYEEIRLHNEVQIQVEV